MEMAKKLEEKEGPGDIQVCCFYCACFLVVINCKLLWMLMFLHLHTKLLEVEDGVYQRMETSSENDGQ